MKKIILLSLVLLSACSNNEKESAKIEKAKEQISSKVEAKVVKVDATVNKDITLKIDEKTGLIIDTGWDLVAGQCGVCHSTKLVIQNSGDREHWLGLIRWMQKTQNLWPIVKDTEDKILDYLAKNYGEKQASRRQKLSAKQMPPEQFLPAGHSQVKKAQQLLKPFKMGLMGALKGGMKAGGPQKALESCKLDAPKILKMQQKEGVKMGRSSHKLRNSENIMPQWAENLQRSFRIAGTKVPYLTAHLENGKVGYVEAIYMKPLCLTCHGENLDGKLAAKIKQHYPNDAATGFKAGDYRGLFWVELPALKVSQ